jgi:nicotinamide riboside kinase
MEENLKQQPSEVVKITLYGPESTGKSTLCKQLADHFETVWAPEFARDYLQQKWDNTQKICEPEDLLSIAIGQIKAENEGLLTANKYLFCDTNLLVTKVFSEIYYNFCDPALDEAAKKHQYDLFFLTDVDVPWEKDDLRSDANNRQKTFEVFKNTLIENKKPFVVLSGNQQQRLEKAIEIINQLSEAKLMGFDSYDFVQIQDQKINLKTISTHLSYYKNGLSKTNIAKPAILNDGILFFSENDFQALADFFDENKKEYKLKKFVPASGAASRMFKFLIDFLNEFDFEHESINAYIIRKKAGELNLFLAGLEKFPFFVEIHQTLINTYPNFKTWTKDKKNYFFIKQLLGTNHLDFANKPKGILPFHVYEKHVATPIEEHLKESVNYSISNNNSFLHFTISESHKTLFETIIAAIKPRIENKSHATITVKFSFQNKASDVLAVGSNNMPLRDENGKLIFRPGGHGALIENLNNVDADIVFIKNIDNIIINQTQKINSYKKALAGLLVELQNQTFDFLNQIKNKQIVADSIQNIVNFATKKLFLELKEDFEKYTFDHQLNYLYQTLNRPIRVCGMVKNEGEPGGGPFWVKDEKGQLSLQIVETNQIDFTNPTQRKHLENATHFNPVDLVCGLKSHEETKFDLLQFVDLKSGFIVEKNKNGVNLKAYELPGLWNGAMSKWITIFVEVPLITFNPVKTVNDLLKPSHQQN